ncbi:mTERF domain-containing protein, mitochondrial [Marchantia polymorpha subsp. ruderalis]|uniref:Uncharacterized protein n=2 Tax=Marchantia polymorpha TaxID=3197 RepID=A0AAF6AKK9_MARPO|nr:hypothetical protein MARPO_0029s0044 [Marchantia polymorpha]BBM96979.1 hypothetical protein Mp_1g02020 [Marchantia polymorpha subsp. ruderalis]|eukprot:PTQ42502.1 hypothetical protein MARPO_0029s0044 [Marchantia polymorpha]
MICISGIPWKFPRAHCGSGLSVGEPKQVGSCGGSWNGKWNGGFLSKSARQIYRVRAVRTAEGVGEGTSEFSLDWRHLVGEREEAKAVVSQFLRSRGFSASVATRTLKNATLFTAHLLGILHSQHRARYLAGEELGTEEIQGTLLPYLESLAAKYGRGTPEVIVSFPDVPAPWTGGDVLYSITTDSEGQEKVIEVNLAECPALLGHCIHGKLPAAVSYCLSIGMTSEQINDVIQRFPAFAHYSVDNKIMKVIDYVLGMGCCPTSIPKIIMKRPQLFGCSVEENLRPTARFLESNGVEPEKWAKIMVNFPQILTYSRKKLQLVIDFLLEIGIPPATVGRVLSRFPHLVGYSLEAKLRPMAMYFKLIGIPDFSLVVIRSPQTLGLSLEKNIKCTVEFFLGLGYSIEQVAVLVNRFPQILGLNVENNLLPKWKFFIKMRRKHSELIDFPQYFGYSLEKRIRPRNAILESRGVTWTLNRMLSTTDQGFQTHLDKCDGALAAADQIRHAAKVASEESVVL